MRRIACALAMALVVACAFVPSAFAGPAVPTDLEKAPGYIDGSPFLALPAAPWIGLCRTRPVCQSASAAGTNFNLPP